MSIEEIEFFLKQVKGIIKNRGKDIYARRKIGSYSTGDYGVEAEVLTSSEDEFYRVELTVDQHSNEITGNCTCPYFEQNDEDCKHIAAVAYFWIDVLKGKISAKEKLMPKGSTIPVQKIDISSFNEFEFKVKSLEDWVIYNLLNKRTRNLPYNLNSPKENIKEKKYTLTFVGEIMASARYIEHGVLGLGCNCNELDKNFICTHIFVLLEKIAHLKGIYHFNSYTDYNGQKNAILEKFGLKVGDELADKFEFRLNYWGELELKEQPKNLLKRNDYENWQNKLKNIIPVLQNDINLPENNKTIADIKDVGLVIQLGGKYNLPIWIDGVTVIDKKNNAVAYKKIVLQDNNSLAIFSHLPNIILVELAKLTAESLLSYLKQNADGHYYYSTNTIFNKLDGQSIVLLTKRIAEILTVLVNLSHPELLFFTIDPHLTFTNVNCKPAYFSNEKVNLGLVLSHQKNFYSLTANLNTEKGLLELKDITVKLPLCFKNENQLYLIAAKDIPLLEIFQDGNVMVHESEIEAFVQRIIKPLSKNYPLQIDEMFEKIAQDTEPLPVIYLSELNDSFLMIRPKWKYADDEVEMDGEAVSLFSNNKRIYQVQRNCTKEQEFVEYLKTLHPRFKLQNNKEYFYLPFSEVMEKNWFLDFFESLQNINVQVFGFKDLKKIKYNSNKPTLKVNSSSGIDWFDLELEVHYGDEVVGLAELKKAILSNQQYILLKDGSLGMLPEEWIKKYSQLFRMGQVSGNNLKISKFHYTILDELYDQLDDAAIQEELDQKRQNLSRVGGLKEIDLPKNIQATLRDYQLAGYQWMHQLRDLGWGGCLADDMGLGKTLQTLTFLQDCIAKKSKETHLIVCPTSLIYNWESEIQKFTPNLKYYIHYGVDRHLSKLQFDQNDLIITSYGMVRSDIEHLNAFKFGYLILDESQAIKNPGAQITKAVQLIKASNRLILSGTPVQNNTFDLYAQMNFLNPGMLGNMEFFKREFATPIDKYGDKTKSEELRKLIYPFMLRRTKEQVAKDLPDKTEMVLWCEMEKAQRNVYDYYKNYYRENLMQRIAEDGMGKSSIYILEGLLKLRQICDSPALIKDEVYERDSAKLTELVRELEDNTGTHKVLVFSQFVEMLSLIKSELDQRNINYSYLDGATPAIKRKDAVKRFQDDDSLRVFLISLKAGGVGLNLTSADYVYLVDPWWNPAAEQQAIDRTHRIGQTNKVFAYKMICKDTVEEKILQLQQKKKALAVDLISDEEGFVKKLTKDDVVFLFS